MLQADRIEEDLRRVDKLWVDRDKYRGPIAQLKEKIDRIDDLEVFVERMLPAQIFW